MPAGDYLTRGIMDLIRRIVREEVTKSRVTALSGGGYTVAPTVNGVVAHGHDSAAHTGLTTDNHHAEVHAVDGADHTFPEGDGSTFLNDQGDFVAPSGGTPTLAEVLVAGNLMGGTNIVSADDVTGGAGAYLQLTDAGATSGGQPSLVGGAGLSGVPGGSVALYGGAGDGGTATPASIDIEGGHADGTPGRMSIYAAGSDGDAGQVLTSDGTYATWQDPTGGLAVFEWENA